MELWEGGLGLALGLVFIVQILTYRGHLDEDMTNIFTYSPLIGGGALFLISGFLLGTLANKPVVR
jgi:uncharacterized membrane protein YedE/YeeE